MRKHIFFLLFFILTMLTFSEDRKLYIGDTITLKIETYSIEEEEIRDKFKEFEIEKIEKKDDQYLISFRTFKAGNYEIQLGNNKIKLNINSSLGDFKTKEIIEEESVKARNFIQIKEDMFLYKIIFLLISIILIIIFLIIILIKVLKKGKKIKKDEKILLLEEILSGKLGLDLLIVKFKKYLAFEYNEKLDTFTARELLEFLKGKLNDENENFNDLFLEIENQRYAKIEVKEEIEKKLYEEIISILKNLKKEVTKNV